MRPRCLALVPIVLLGSCLPATERDFQIAQTVIELGDAVNELRQVSYELQDRVDSIATVVIRRDSVIRVLANLAGVQVPP
jgi:hypothetical protein